MCNVPVDEPKMLQCVPNDSNQFWLKGLLITRRIKDRGTYPHAPSRSRQCSFEVHIQFTTCFSASTYSKRFKVARSLPRHLLHFLAPEVPTEHGACERKPLKSIQKASRTESDPFIQLCNISSFELQSFPPSRKESKRSFRHKPQIREVPSVSKIDRILGRHSYSMGVPRNSSHAFTFCTSFKIFIS